MKKIFGKGKEEKNREAEKKSKEGKEEHIWFAEEENREGSYLLFIGKEKRR